MLTGSLDDTARLWDAASGDEVRIFSGHNGSVESVAFSPDGRFVLTGSQDITARLWDAAYRDFTAYACTRVFRDLMPEERTQFGIADDAPTCPQFAPLVTSPQNADALVESALLALLNPHAKPGANQYPSTNGRRSRGIRTVQEHKFITGSR